MFGRILLVLFLATFWACRVEQPDRVISGTPINLFDHLKSAELEGQVSLLADGSLETEKSTLLSLNFEDEKLAPLLLNQADPDRVQFIAGSAAFKGTSLRLSGSPQVLPVVRSRALRIKPELTYHLRYEIATDHVPFLPTKKSWQAKITLYRLSPQQFANPDLVLQNPKLEKKARLPDPVSFSVPVFYSSKPWNHVEDTFWVSPEATHLVVSFGFGPATNANPRFKSYTAVRFDNIELSALSNAVGHRFKLEKKNPLKISVPLFGRHRQSAQDLRYGIYSPAPSELRFKVKIPEDAVLSFGYGMLPETGSRDNSKKLFFEVYAGEEQIFSENPAYITRPAGTWSVWEDANLDLKKFAGKEIVLRLKTSSTLSAKEKGLNYPQAGMAWSMPVLYNRSSSEKTVVFFIIDAFPAKASSLYGYPLATTPQLKRIAAEGINFTRALAPSPWTLPSFASFLSGKDVLEHRAGQKFDGNSLGKIPLRFEIFTLAERLRAAGWETKAWVNNPYLTTPSGLYQGFSRYFDYGTRSVVNAAQAGMHDLLKVLENSRGRRQFLLVHLLDPHGPYLPNEEYKVRFGAKGTVGRVGETNSFEIFSKLVTGGIKLTSEEKKHYRKFYDAVLNYADFHLGRVFDAVKKNLGTENLLFFATSDHGEEFWEHDYYEHAHSVYGELLHVPLVVFPPGRQRMVQKAVAVQDLVPTILDFAGLNVSTGSSNFSLLSCLKECDPKIFERVLISSGASWGFERYAVEADHFKYIYTSNAAGGESTRSRQPEGNYELYNIKKDPEEKNNIFHENLGSAGRLHQELVRRVIKTTANGYLIYFDSGKTDSAKAGKLSGKLIGSDNNFWSNIRIEDFIWPSEKTRGSTGRSLFRKQIHGNTLMFELTAQRAVIKFTLGRKEQEEVKVELRFNDKTLPRKWMKIRKTVDSAQKLIFPEGQTPERREPLIVIMPLRDALPVESKIKPELNQNLEEIQSQLESLGYMR